MNEDGLSIKLEEEKFTDPRNGTEQYGMDGQGRINKNKTYGT